MCGVVIVMSLLSHQHIWHMGKKINRHLFDNYICTMYENIYHMYGSPATHLCCLEDGMRGVANFSALWPLNQYGGQERPWVLQ